MSSLRRSIRSCWVRVVDLVHGGLERARLRPHAHHPPRQASRKHPLQAKDQKQTVQVKTTTNTKCRYCYNEPTQNASFVTTNKRKDKFLFWCAPLIIHITFSRLREGSGCSSGYGSIKGCSPPPRRNTENGLFREIFPPAEVSPLVTREIHERLFEDIDTSESGIVSGNPPPPAVVGRAQPIWPAEGGRDTPSRHVVTEMRQSQESRYQTL